MMMMMTPLKLMMVMMMIFGDDGDDGDEGDDGDDDDDDFLSGRRPFAVFRQRRLLSRGAESHRLSILSLRALCVELSLL